MLVIPDLFNESSNLFTAPTNISTNRAVLVFELTTNDDQNTTGISTVKVTVNPVNHPRTANAGINRIISPGNIVTLGGTKSRDLGGNITSYLWKQISSPAVASNGISIS